MIIVCQHCTSRFRIDDAKVPTGSFTVSCPKCRETVTSNGVSAAENSALAVGKSPATSHSRADVSRPAPLFKLNSGGLDETFSGASTASAANVNELASALISLLKPEKSARVGRRRPSWDHRRVLVCTAEKHRERIARALTENGYEVFVAEDTQQAVERMRESHLDVAILDPDFDPVEQGAAFVTREVNVLRPIERRRLFFVYLSPSKRTLDAHAAFLQNLNLVINFNELPELPGILDRSVREYNDLYKDFYAALDIAPI
jgi:predicted Zn finger-like uncharacterized protein